MIEGQPGRVHRWQRLPSMLAGSAVAGYWQALTGAWPLVAGLTLLFGWLLAFPLQGPLLGLVASERQFDPLPVVQAFAGAHALGLLVSGLAAFRWKAIVSYFPLGLLICLALTLLLALASPADGWRVLLFGTAGLSSAPVVMAWADAFARTVPPLWRGRVLALSAAGANLVLYLAAAATQWASAPALLVGAALALVLAVPVFIVLRRESGYPASGAPTGAPALRPMRLATYWPLLPFLFGVYLVGGVMYGLVLPVVSAGHPRLFQYYSVLPYIVLLFPAGLLADKVGRRLDAHLGAVVVGTGFVAFGLLGGFLRDVSVHSTLIGGFAFLDVFVWVVLADLSAGHRSSLAYGLGLGTNVLAIFLGLMLVGDLAGLVQDEQEAATYLSALVLFLTLAMAPALRETLARAPVPPAATEGLGKRYLQAGLTRREQEIAQLLFNGASTEEILEQLVISRDTLKTHLRNVYRKMGVRDRRELTRLLVNELHQAIQGMDSGQAGRSSLPPA